MELINSDYSVNKVLHLKFSHTNEHENYYVLVECESQDLTDDFGEELLSDSEMDCENVLGDRQYLTTHQIRKAYNYATSENSSLNKSNVVNATVGTAMMGFGAAIGCIVSSMTAYPALIIGFTAVLGAVSAGATGIKYQDRKNDRIAVEDLSSLNESDKSQNNQNIVKNLSDYLEIKTRIIDLLTRTY